MEAQDKIAAQMKEAARNAESQAFPGMERVWERVTEKLDGKPENKVVPFFSYKKIAAAAAVLIILGLGSAYLFTEKKDAPVVAANRTAPIINTPTPIAVDTIKTIAFTEGTAMQETPHLKFKQVVVEPQINENAAGVATDMAPSTTYTVEPSSGIAPALAQSQTEIIRGKIVDENGEGIPGATVKLLGAERGTQTDIEGNYELEIVKARPTLEVIAMGYRDQNIFTDNNLNAGTVALSPSKNNLADIAITMPNSTAPSTATFNDTAGIVLNGTVKDITTQVEASGYSTMQVSYGSGATLNVNKAIAGNQNYTTNKGNQLTPAQSYTAQAFSNTPKYNKQQSNLKGSGYYNNSGTDVVNAAESVAPGVQVINGSGVTVVNRRNTDLVKTSNAPLIIVDGVVYNKDITSINPQDVVRMTTLKDSVATRIYGSRGVNGVIVITTKSGLQTAEKKVKKQSAILPKK